MAGGASQAEKAFSLVTCQTAWKLSMPCTLRGHAWCAAGALRCGCRPPGAAASCACGSWRCGMQHGLFSRPCAATCSALASCGCGPVLVMHVQEIGLAWRCGRGVADMLLPCHRHNHSR